MTSHNRFKELVHYVCWQCREFPEKLGATELYKILWYVDSLSYCLFGASISGETAYVKRQHGPVPERSLVTLEELQTEGVLSITEVPCYVYTRRHFVSLRDPDLSVFTDQERQLIDDIVRLISEEHTAASISELSHDSIWEAAQMGEKIPLYAVLAGETDEITDDDITWANKLIEQRASLTVSPDTQTGSNSCLTGPTPAAL